ncbi:AbiH family protein [Ligilactobacillus ruminis]|uniref:AbiH family protein n=1 Tax=Ligilactobacillus ruminis TaxID=1623 RepID=UPI003F9D85D1
MEYYKIVNNNICINNKEANQLNKQILVIGNGFDLSCGLDSRYSDFFKYRFIELFGKQKSHEQIRF